MAGERMYPILSYPDLDEAIAFYQALGFRQTYLQRRPNPHAVVALEDLAVHLSGVPGVDPAASLGSVIVVVPDVEALYERFRAGLRAALGRVPVAGIPRLLRVRRKAGTAVGFSVVDPGGNWLRVYPAEASEDEERSEGLARVLEVAARQGDARGDDRQALAVLDVGLARHPDAPAIDRVRVLLYRTEILVRLNRPADAAACLDVARSVPLDPADADAVAGEFADASELVAVPAPRR